VGTSHPGTGSTEAPDPVGAESPLGDPHSADDELVRSAAGGDRQALEELLLRHYDRVYGLCRRMLCNDADAEDAVQDTLLSAVKNLARFDRRSSFGTWIYRIATNTCLDELRRRRRRPVPSLVDLAEYDSQDRSWSRPAGESPAEIVTARIDVDVALGGLGTEFRTAVVLRDFCDFSYEEIATLLEIPVGTVRSRIARARAGLADQLGNFDARPNVQGRT